MKTLNEQLDRIKTMMGLINEVEVSIDYLYNKKFSDIPRETFDKVLDADPKYNGKQPSNFSLWMINLIRKNDLKSEDLYKVKEYLELLIRNKNKVEIKDINQIKSVPSLFSIIKKFLEKPEDNKSNSSLEKEIKKDARKVYSDDEWLVIVPETKEASCYYGKGTQWCTAASKNDYEQNMFDHYKRYGDLYININKKSGNKFQCSFPDSDSGESVQIMDVNDHPVEGDAIRLLNMSEGLVNFYKEEIGWVVEKVFGNFYENMTFPKPNYDGFYEIGQFLYTPDNGEMLDYYNLGQKYSIEKGYVCFDGQSFAKCPIEYDSPKELEEKDIRFIDRGEVYMVMNFEGGNSFVSNVDTGDIINTVKVIEYTYDGELLRRGNEILNLDDEVVFKINDKWGKFQILGIKFVVGSQYVEVRFNGNQRVHFNRETGEQIDLVNLNGRVFAINGYGVKSHNGERMFKLPDTFNGDFDTFSYFNDGYYNLDKKFYDVDGNEISSEKVDELLK